MPFTTRRSPWLALACMLTAWLVGLHDAWAQALPPYEAKAALLKVAVDGGDRPDVEIFHAAYTQKGADPAKRPVTFVFNGGPGGASIFLHLSALGPRTVATAGDGSFPPVPARLEDNPDSWLAFTDLVFVDPVGTGYSRMLPGADGKPGDPKRYYSVDSDVDACAAFIRQWLTVNKRWGSPKGIAGESYAGQRIAALTRVLAEQHSINLNRVVLISPAFNVPTLTSTQAYDLLHPITLLPTQAAIAAFHGKSSIKNDADGYRSAETFALKDYLTGLATLGQASAVDEAAFHARVGALIGIDPALVARHRGRVPEAVFATSLLGAQGKVLDTYDGTQASDNPTPEKRDELGVFPRSLSVLTGVLLPPFMDYVQKDLGHVSDRPYIVLNLVANALWDRKSTAGTPEDLAIALTQNTDLKVLVVHGYHDLSTNYMLSRFVLGQAVRAPSAVKRLSFQTYPGGHMFYLHRSMRAAMAADVRRLYETTP